MSRVCPVRGIAVYPRWRGEHALLLSQIRESGRFIPAGAGNTEREGQTVNNAPVYPRWRGEHTCEIFSVFGIDGLSPLARGTRGNLPGDNVYGRFIPAGAGNTCEKNGSIARPAVYPRWRGEHIIRTPPRKCWNGLSPLARGTRDHAERRQPDVRFIPAGAGNTITGCLVLICSPVYPRWRGEHPCDAQRQRVKTGLSPLARGTLK